MTTVSDGLVVPAVQSVSTKAGPVDLPVGATAGEAYQLSIDACLTHLAPNEAGWLEQEHPDFLHQTRVSTRRLRALLSLARELIRDDPVAQDLKARLRAILSPLGPARDLDVALKRARDEEWAADDISRLSSARTVAYAGVREVLTSTAWHQLWVDLEQWRRSPQWLGQVAELRDGPARVVTDAALERRHQRIIDAGPELMTMSEHDLHRLRIEAKKLRYGCQFFDTLYSTGEQDTAGEQEADLSAPLQVADLAAGMQDTFGVFNDLAVADALRTELGLTTPPSAYRPSREDCVAVWAEVAAAPRFWRSGR